MEALVRSAQRPIFLLSKKLERLEAVTWEVHTTMMGEPWGDRLGAPLEQGIGSIAQGYKD